MTAFCGIAPCRLVEADRRYRDNHPDDGDSILLSAVYGTVILKLCSREPMMGP